MCVSHKILLCWHGLGYYDGTVVSVCIVDVIIATFARFRTTSPGLAQNSGNIALNPAQSDYPHKTGYLPIPPSTVTAAFLSSSSSLLPT